MLVIVSPPLPPPAQLHRIRGKWLPLISVQGGREKAGFFLCPKLWTFRGTSWAIGFWLASLRAQIELSTLQMPGDLWEQIRAEGHVLQNTHGAAKSRTACGLSLKGGRRGRQASTALSFSELPDRLNLSTDGIRVPGEGHWEWKPPSVFQNLQYDMQTVCGTPDWDLANLFNKEIRHTRPEKTHSRKRLQRSLDSLARLTEEVPPCSELCHKDWEK